VPAELLFFAIRTALRAGCVRLTQWSYAKRGAARACTRASARRHGKRCASRTLLAAATDFSVSVDCPDGSVRENMALLCKREECSEPAGCPTYPDASLCYPPNYDLSSSVQVAGLAGTPWGSACSDAGSGEDAVGEAGDAGLGEAGVDATVAGSNGASGSGSTSFAGSGR